MPRKHLIRTTEFPYHVTFRGNNQEPFPMPLRDVWELFLHYFREIALRYAFELHAFVLMPNHGHLILSTPAANLDAGMRYFLTETSQKMSSKSGRINHIYGGRYKWSVIQSRDYLVNALRYVYLNPVQAKICTRPEQFEFSTILSDLGFRPNTLSTTPHPELQDLLNEPNFFLEWINLPFTEKHWKVLERASQRKIFRFPKDNNFQGTVDDLQKSADVLFRRLAPKQKMG